MPNRMEEWWAGRQEEKKRAEETPQERVIRLKALNDEALSSMLERWGSIRTAQDAGSGVRDDVIELDRLFATINQRLTELKEPMLSRQEDLP